MTAPMPPTSSATTTAGAGGPPPNRLPGFLMGIGFGGFVDGIVMHQILQWHHVLSDTAANPPGTIPGKEANVTADGFFHAATWVLLLVGTLLLVRSWQQGRLAPRWRFHVGLLLAGWGAFNLAEGVVNHQLLQVHHVRDDLGGPLSWDLAFLASGVLLAAVGRVLHRRGAPGARAVRAGRPRSATTARP